MLSAFLQDKLGLGLAILKPHVERLASMDISSRYESLTQDYAYMLRFMTEGYKDPQREKLYGEMLAKGYHIASDVKRLLRIINDTALVSLQKTVAADDNSASNLIEALRDESLDAKAHYEVLNRAFVSIFLSSDWREQEQRLWTAYLISTEVKSADAQVIVSAIMLGCMLGYCVEKYKTLCYVYMTSEDMYVRQRAFVGWVLCYQMSNRLMKHDAETQDMLVEQMLEDDNTCSELVEMIMQVVICTEAEKDNKVIQKEIMPDILKGNHFKFSPKDGLVEKDETLDDILNPGESELAMEKMEQGIKRMSNMQKAGVDIFYAGFSQMKRYPFFYKLVNWFMPFDIKHPDLGETILNDEGLQSIAKVFTVPTLCSSDKYSFLFALKSVLPTLPEDIRKAMAGGEMAIVGMGNIDNTITEESAYVRRMYLQDLYRFFKLSPQVKMPNVFVETSWMQGLADKPQLKGRCVELAKFLLRHDKLAVASEVALKAEDSEERNLVLATVAEKRGENPLEFYNRVLATNGDSVPAIKGIARYYLQNGNGEALPYCQRLCELCPDVFAYELNRLHAFVLAGKVEENLNDFYRLDFEHPDDPKVKRLIAWALLCLGRYEKAEELYLKILEGKWGETSKNDFLCMIDLYFFSGNMRKCVEACLNFIDAYPLKDNELSGKWNELYSVLSDEFKLLEMYHKYSPSDVSLLVDAVLGE